MSLLGFLLEAVLISLSGVMAPGPISAVAVGKGSDSPHAGALVAIGHGVVEFPLMALDFWGFGALLELSYVQSAIALVGGGLLLFMGIDMLRKIKRAEIGTRRGSRSPLAAGILLSIGNPYVLIWWMTVGAALIARSLQFGMWGLVALALAHWLCDLSWSYLLSIASYRGGRFFGRRFQEAGFVLCGAFLVLFGARYVIDAIKVFLA
jgi:threonine/homoserine/homoserine lactone efflux protein